MFILYRTVKTLWPYSSNEIFEWENLNSSQQLSQQVFKDIIKNFRSDASDFLKKYDKKLKKNYRFIGLLHIFANIHITKTTTSESTGRV